MPDLNPYEPPQTVDPLPEAMPKLILPHTTSVRDEAWRGAKFGARIISISFGPLMIVFLFLEFYFQSKNYSLNGQPRFTEIIKLVASGFGGLAILIVLSAVAGAAVMGCIAWLRKMKAARKDKHS
jgi:hypothetical protein